MLVLLMYWQRQLQMTPSFAAVEPRKLDLDPLVRKPGLLHYGSGYHIHFIEYCGVIPYFRNWIITALWST